MARHTRSRIRGGDYIHPGYNIWSGNGYVTGPDPVVTFDRYEVIRDVNNGNKGEAHPCFHEVFTAKLHDLYPFSASGYTNTPQRMRPMISTSDVSTFVPDFPDSLRSQLNEEAFIAFSTQFPEVISGSEFILGLRQLADLIPKLERSFTKTASGLYLNKKFGWDNLLSDLRAMSSIVATMRQRIEFLKKSRGKPTRLGFFRGDVYKPTLGITTDFAQYPGWGTRLELKAYRADYRATATLLHLLDHLDDTLGLLRALAFAFGLGNPLKAIWVNLPFSFVVDWFLQVSKHLDRLAAIHPAELWSLSKITHSTRIRVTVNVYQDNRATGDTLKSLGTVEIDQYDRRVGLPIGLDVYTPTDLSPSQLALMLALLGANSH